MINYPCVDALGIEEALFEHHEYMLAMRPINEPSSFIHELYSAKKSRVYISNALKEENARREFDKLARKYGV